MGRDLYPKETATIAGHLLKRMGSLLTRLGQFRVSREGARHIQRNGPLCSRQVANYTDFNQSSLVPDLSQCDAGLSSKGIQATGPETTRQPSPGRVLRCTGSVAISKASLKGICGSRSQLKCVL